MAGLRSIPRLGGARTGVGYAVADRPWLAAVAALTVLAAVLRLSTLDRSALWFDEAVTLSLVRMDLGRMLAHIPDSESTPPLYYVVAWVWGRLAGAGQLASRALPALAGIATVPAAYAAGAALATRRVGVSVAALVAVSPLLVWHSQDARAYSLLVLLCAVSLWAFALALDVPTPRRLAGWALAAGAALLTHYFAVFLVVGEAGWLLARARAGTGRRVRVLAVAAGVGVVAAALVPLALHQRAHGGAAWLAERVLGARIGNLWPHFVAGYGAAPGPLASYEQAVPVALLVVAGALAVVALAAAIWVGVRGGREADAAPADRRESRALAVAATLLAATLGLPLLLALAGVDYVFTRNLLPAWLLLALIVAIGIGARRAGRAGALLGVVLCGALAAITALAATTPRFGPHRWEHVTRGLGGAQSARVVMVPASTAMPLALERPGLATLPAAGVRVDEIDVLRRGPERRRAPAHGFRLVRTRILGDSFTLLRFRAATPTLVTPRALLGDDPVRRQRTAVLYAPPLVGLGSSASAPPALFFCGPGPGERRTRISIRTPCAKAYPPSGG